MSKIRHSNSDFLFDFAPIKFNVARLILFVPQFQFSAEKFGAFELGISEALFCAQKPFFLGGGSLNEKLQLKVRIELGIPPSLLCFEEFLEFVSAIWIRRPCFVLR